MEIIEGITVLNTYEQEVSATWGWNIIATIFLILGVIGFIISVILCLNDEQLLGAVGIMSAIIMIFVCAAINLHENPICKTVYQVTINEDVNFVQVNEKYKIIKQEGRIYHIMEKVEE